MCYWFMVRLNDKRGTMFVVPAESEEIIRAKFPAPCGVSYVGALTWKSLSRMLGCVIPSGVDEKDSASGPLMFNLEGVVSSLWPYLSK